MNTSTFSRHTRLLPGLLALLVAAAGCTPRGSDPQLRLPGRPPSALAIVSPAPGAALAAIRAAVIGPGRLGEHLEVVDPVKTARPVVISSLAPLSPGMPGPLAPARPLAGATNYQMHAYDKQYQIYKTRLAEVRRALAAEYGGRLRGWSASIVTAVSRAPAGAGGRAHVLAGLSEAEGFFSSLDQASAGLGRRKVIVLISTPAMSVNVIPLPPSSLAGATVILANFSGGQAAEAEWQADLLQAGASRAVVLATGAQNELATVIAQGLDGQRGTVPVEVRFALNRANLGPADRAALSRLASRLIRTCPDAPVTILGFADPLGAPTHNAQLAQQRAITARAYLVSLGVSAARLSAAGYGTSLPAAPANAQGAQPLDRRAVIVIDPVPGHLGC